MILAKIGPSIEAGSQSAQKVAPGCVVDKLRIICDAVGSGESKHATLLVPVDWQGLCARETGAGQARRLATFEDGSNDVGREAEEPCQLRKIVWRKALVLRGHFDWLAACIRER